MKKHFVTFLFGAITGVAGVWFVQWASQPEQLALARTSLTNSAAHLKSSLQHSFQDWSVEAIREELAATSMVVREKARQAGQVIMTATANARTTMTIKSKLVSESGLRGLQINVDTAGGIVTLSGTATTHEQVARAVRLALETEGVTKVISTIQVQP